MINEKQLLEIVDGILTAYNNLDYLSDPVRRIAVNDSAKRMYEFYELLPKRKPYLFKITTTHNGEQKLNSEVFYLEPKEDPKDFKERCSKHLEKMYGTGTITKQGLKL